MLIQGGSIADIKFFYLLFQIVKEHTISIDMRFVVFNLRFFKGMRLYVL